MKSIDHTQITALPPKGDSRTRALKEIEGRRKRVGLHSMLQKAKLEAKQATARNKSNFKRNVTDKVAEPFSQSTTTY